MASVAQTNESQRPEGTDPSRPSISVVIATHNRCAVVAETLARLGRCELSRRAYEIIAVDNASTDRTRGVLAGLADHIIELPRNRGSCAKAYGVTRARGRYVVFLDDDSCPRAGSLSRMIERFEADPQLGAAGFSVHLPDGTEEGGALPGVFVGCGVGFRAAALRAVGGLDPSFFMQAEEYDVCFRLAGAGWKVDVFDDLYVDHRKTAAARRPSRTSFYDIRNNLRVLARYAPAAHHASLREDCIERYAWLSEALGHEDSYRRGLRAGKLWGWLERLSYRRRRMRDEVFERFFCWGELERRMRELAGRGVKRIVMADLGKNIFGFFRAAQRSGLEVEAIGDDRFAAAGRLYRGVPVLPLGEALSRDVDAIVVSNASAVQARLTTERVRESSGMPVFSFFAVGAGQDEEGLNFGTPSASADNTREQSLEVAGA